MEKLFVCCFLIFIYSSVPVSAQGDSCQCVSKELRKSESGNLDNEKHLLFIFKKMALK